MRQRLFCAPFLVNQNTIVCQDRLRTDRRRFKMKGVIPQAEMTVTAGDGECSQFCAWGAATAGTDIDGGTIVGRYIISGQ